jgi:hypothetical protein
MTIDQTTADPSPRDGVRARRAVRLYADAFLGLDIAIGASRTSASLACDVS